MDGLWLDALAGISFAFGQVAYRDWKSKNSKVKDLSVFAFLTLGGTFGIGIFSVLLTDFNSIELSTDNWKSIVYLGCIASGAGFFLWNKGASQTNPGTLAAFNNAVVPIAVLFSLFWFEEKKDIENQNLIRLIIGSTMIFIAVFLSQRKN